MSTEYLDADVDVLEDSHDNSGQNLDSLHQKVNRYRILSILLLGITLAVCSYHFTTVNSLEKTVSNLSIEVNEKDEKIYSLNSLLNSAMSTVDTFRENMSNLVTTGIISESLYNDTFPKSEAELLEEEMSKEPLELDIDSLILAYTNRADDPLYTSYDKKHLAMTAYVKRVNNETKTLSIDDIEMSSFFGSNVKLKDGYEFDFTSLKEGDKIKVYGLGDTSKTTFSIIDCYEITKLD